MPKYITKSLLTLILSIGMTIVCAAEKVELINPEQEAQAKYLKNVIQKEIWSIILTDTFELQKEELKENIIFKSYGLYDVEKYQNWMTEICVEEKTSSCPEVFFTKKKNISVAAMYPNGKMYLNVNILPFQDLKGQESLSGLPPEISKVLTEEEIYFTIAHEMGHFVLQHGIKKTEFMADTMVEKGFMVTEMEKIVAASFMLPGMREYHYQVEDQADMFAVKHMKKKKMKIDCLKMFIKMLGEDKVSTEQHEGSEDRCRKIQSE